MIDREKVIKAIEICYTVGHNCTECPFFHKDECNDELMHEALAILREQKAVVRCKDCKHSCDYTDIFHDRAYKCIKNGGYHNDSWFCADGERQ